MTAPFRVLGRWYRDSDWSKHAAVLAALVAAGSLAVTAWGTWKSAQVADDQLAQSREAAEDRIRQQAAKVTFWEDTKNVVITNRSMDPVYAYLYVDVDRWRRPLPLLRVGFVPPCQRLTVPADEVQEHLSTIRGRFTGKFVHVDSLYMLDSDSYFWRRMRGGQLEMVYSTPGLPEGQRELIAARGTKQVAIDCVSNN
ncbi:hypothetical protein [Streptomyces sp. NPDC127100]|uniref:hypothetical protein n=1 Tax=Streptomyces sp. NPDC127100 TaxID=3347138 RepID=UPI003659217C